MAKEEKAIDYQLTALQEIRRLSRNLNPAGLSSSGLKNGIEDILYNLNTLKGLKVQFDFDERLEERLGNAEKLSLYRVVQEQTNNIIKYAHATQVTLTLKMEEPDVILEISDNGQGFDPAALTANGIGLTNMQYRASAHNGKFMLRSAPGRGCTIALRFPLAH